MSRTELQPKAEERLGSTLEETLTGILGVQATVPEDAFTAPTLGTERAGSGSPHPQGTGWC